MPYDSSNKMNYGGPKMHKGGPHMESVKQERSNLLHDNPVAKDASGGRPWIAKHFKSTMGSAAKMGHESPNEMGHESPNEMKYGGPQMGHEDSPAEKALVGKQKNLNPGLRAAIEAAPEMKYGEGPEMGHDSPAEAHCMGPRMENKGSAFRKEFSIEEAKKRMEERKKKEKAKEEAKK
tara:strand:- start:663 stop:1196 length:534 start_codon:yes stop_codon:yes gene_type:complete